MFSKKDLVQFIYAIIFLIFLTLEKIVVTNRSKFVLCSYRFYNMSRVMRKTAFCICKNKDADQLRGNREADQRLCFRYMDSTIPFLPKSEISNL